MEVFKAASTNTRRLESFNCNSDSVDTGDVVSSTPEPVRTAGPMPGGKLQVCVFVCVYVCLVLSL